MIILLMILCYFCSCIKEPLDMKITDPSNNKTNYSTTNYDVEYHDSTPKDDVSKGTWVKDASTYII